MIRQLLALQFALFFVPLLLISLVVYGFNSRESMALFYLIPIVLYIVCRLRMQQCQRLLASARLGHWLVASGLVCAFLLYQPLHMGTVDEQSGIQAVLMAILGCISLLLSVRSTDIAHMPSDKHLGLVLLSLAPAWGLSFYHQHIGIWVLAVFFALGLLQNTGKPAVTGHNTAVNRPLFSAALISYGIFLCCLEASLIVWDLRENQDWAWHLALLMACAALGFFIAVRQQKPAILILLASLANMLACTLFAAYVLNPLHSVIAGLGLGVLIYYRQQQAPNHNNPVTLATPVFFGFIISYALSANLQALDMRLVLLLPLPLLFLLPKHRRAGMLISK